MAHPVFGLLSLVQLPIIVCQGPWHTVAQSVWLTYMSNKLILQQLFQNVLGARDLFCFLENFFAQKFHYTV